MIDLSNKKTLSTGQTSAYTYSGSELTGMMVYYPCGVSRWISINWYDA